MARKRARHPPPDIQDKENGPQPSSDPRSVAAALIGHRDYVTRQRLVSWCISGGVWDRQAQVASAMAVYRKTPWRPRTAGVGREPPDRRRPERPNPGPRPDLVLESTS